MTPRQLAEMEKRRAINLRESVKSSLRKGDYQVSATDLWFLAMPRGTKDALREAWGKHMKKQRPDRPAG